MAKYDTTNNPYRWMPGFLRRFLNLEYDEAQSFDPGQGVSRVSSGSASSSVSTARAPWLSPGEPTFKASNMESYRTPTSAPAPSYTPPSTPPYVASNGVSTGSNVGSAPAQVDLSLQPLVSILRGFLIGVLPPQGVEAFTKEVYTTGTDVWNLYSRWFFFQTEGIFQLGRAIIVAVTDSIISITPPDATSAPVRRIKIPVVNNSGSDHNS